MISNGFQNPAKGEHKKAEVQDSKVSTLSFFFKF